MGESPRRTSSDAASGHGGERLGVPFWAVSLSFSYPTPLPPPILQNIYNQQLTDFDRRNSSQNLHNKDFKSQNLESMGLTGQFLVASAPCRYCCVYDLCWDNDETNWGLGARSDVTR